MPHRWPWHGHGARAPLTSFNLSSTSSHNQNRKQNTQTEKKNTILIRPSPTEPTHPPSHRPAGPARRWPHVSATGAQNPRGRGPRILIKSNGNFDVRKDKASEFSASASSPPPPLSCFVSLSLSSLRLLPPPVHRPKSRRSLAHRNERERFF